MWGPSFGYSRRRGAYLGGSSCVSILLIVFWLMPVSREILFFGTPFSRILRRIRCHCLALRYMNVSSEICVCQAVIIVENVYRKFRRSAGNAGHCFCDLRDSSWEAHQVASASISV